VSLTDRQCGLLDDWLGSWEVVAEHSWPLQGTTVLRVRTAAGERVVKAGGGHFEREVSAHESTLSTIDDPRLPRLLHASRDAAIFVTTWLPGDLVEGTPAEDDPDTYRQAGFLLALIHTSPEVSSDYMPRMVAKLSQYLDAARELLAPGVWAKASARVRAIDPRPVEVVFTHGDYQPRNWLIDEGTVRVIDFGRSEWRPAVSDVVRLQHQQFVGRPDLVEAFFAGYGHGPATFDPDVSALEHLLQSLGTVVWAHTMRDTEFEAHGHRMVGRVLAGI
jgi:Ser/Thr protein kinase RdoA (MazF antagonist)